MDFTPDYMPEDGGYVRDKQDKSTVKFYKHPRFNMDYVRVTNQVDPLTMIDEPAGEHHKLRYKRQWDIYQGQAKAFEGQTLLEDVIWMDPGIIGALSQHEVFTVNHLAAMTDETVDATSLEGLGALRELAREHVRKEEAAAKAVSPDVEIRKLRAQVEQLTAQVNRGGDKAQKGGQARA